MGYADRESNIVAISRRKMRYERAHREQSLMRRALHVSRLGPFRVHVFERDLDLPDWPRELDGLRLAHITDIHRGPYVPHYFVERLVELVNDIEPDIVALTGDYVYGPNWRGHRRALEALGGLQAPLGVFATLGNHDWRYRANRRIEKHLMDQGIVVLENRHAVVKHKGIRLGIAGVEDLWAARPDLAKATRGMEADALLALSHHPDVFKRPDCIDGAARLPNLGLAGHTHGGQVVFRKFGAPHMIRHKARTMSGLVDGADFPVYVSRGLGMVAVPIRVNCLAELPVLTLRSAR